MLPELSATQPFRRRRSESPELSVQLAVGHSLMPRRTTLTDSPGVPRRLARLSEGKGPDPSTRALGAIPSAPLTFEDLASQLQANFMSLSVGQRAVARVLLTDPEGNAFRSSRELAAMAGVDPSTVTRFATRVGLSGYPALARLCLRHLREQAQTVSRLDRLQEIAVANVDDPSASTGALTWPLALIAATDRMNVIRTFSRITEEEWRVAVEACSSGRSVYVLGLRKAFAVAYLLTYLLGLIREDVIQVSAEAGLLPDSLRRIRPGDVFVAISIYRYTLLTVQGIRFAKKRGATTIALTDTRASPLAAAADVVFYVETASVSVLRSLTAFTSLAQALAAAVAVSRGTRARSELLTEEDVLEEFGVYAVDPNQIQAKQ